MAIRPITSHDPRKAGVVRWLKVASGARSVTMVQHNTKRNHYLGHCFNRGHGGTLTGVGGGRSFGFFVIDVYGKKLGQFKSFVNYEEALNEGRI